MDGAAEAATFSKLGALAYVQTANAVYVADGDALRRVDAGTGRVDTIAAAKGSQALVAAPAAVELPGDPLALALSQLPASPTRASAALYVACDAPDKLVRVDLAAVNLGTPTDAVDAADAPPGVIAQLADASARGMVAVLGSGVAHVAVSADAATVFANWPKDAARSTAQPANPFTDDGRDIGAWHNVVRCVTSAEFALTHNFAMAASVFPPPDAYSQPRPGGKARLSCVRDDRRRISNHRCNPHVSVRAATCRIRKRNVAGIRT